MDEVLQEFDTLVRDKSNGAFRVFLHGRSRPRDTWQGWLVFVRESDGKRFETPVETTQPNREAVLYWATGLTDAYLEGALVRAVSPRAPAPVRMPARPIVDRGVDHLEHQFRREEIERDVLALFTAARAKKLLSTQIFDAVPHGSADVIRALEHLEKVERMLTRPTEQGNDWVMLTADGVRATSVAGIESADALQ